MSIYDLGKSPVVDEYDYYVLFIQNRLKDSKNRDAIEYCLDILEGINMLVIASDAIYFPIRGEEHNLDIVLDNIREFSTYYNTSSFDTEKQMEKYLEKYGVFPKMRKTVFVLKLIVEYVNEFYHW